MADNRTMSFKDLWKIVDSIAQNNNFTEEDDEVVIGVSDPSIAIRASVPVAMVYSGFDWEMGQVRIEPSEPIYSLKYLKEMIPDIEEQLEKAQKECWKN